MLLKYWSNLWRILAIPLINCEVNLILTWQSTYFITNSTGVGRFAITDKKLYAPVVTLSNQEKGRLLQQLKYGFERIVNWNKYQSDPTTHAQNHEPKTYAQRQYLNYLVNASF